MRYDDAGNEKPMYMVKPTIERISFSLADNDTMAEDLASGKFHLVNKADGWTRFARRRSGGVEYDPVERSSA